MKLAGRTVLVTDAARGMGRLLALALAKEGADIALQCQSSSDDAVQVSERIRSLGRKTLLVNADLADNHAVTRMVSQTIEAFGSLYHVLFHVDSDVTDAADTQGIDATFQGTFQAIRVAARQMIEQKTGGSILVVKSFSEGSSEAVTDDYANDTLSELIRETSDELHEPGIRLNLILPDAMEATGEIIQAVMYCLVSAPGSMTGRVVTVDHGQIRLLNPGQGLLSSRALDRASLKSRAVGIAIKRFVLAMIAVVIVGGLGVYAAFSITRYSTDRDAFNKLVALKGELDKIPDAVKRGQNWNSDSRQMMASIRELERGIKGGQTGSSRRDVARMARCLKEMIDSAGSTLTVESPHGVIREYDRAAKAFNDYKKVAAKKLGLDANAR